MNISIQSILRKIHATSALRSYMSQYRSDSSPLLTPDNNAALRNVISDAIALITISLAPRITDCRLSDDGEFADLTLNQQLSAGSSFPILNALESGVAASTLSMIFADTDSEFSEAQHEAAQSAVTSIITLLDTLSASTGSCPGKIVPSFI